MQHAGTHLQHLIIAALETGCRIGELLSLQWKEISVEERGRWWLMLSEGKTKTARDRAIPVKMRLRSILEMRRHVPADPPELRDVLGDEYGPEHYVFGNELGESIASIRKAWTATCRRAKIVDLHFHDLRREFASRLVGQRGVTLMHVRDVLGHTNVKMTSNYLRSSNIELHDVFEAWERASAEPAATASSSDPLRTNCAQATDQPVPPAALAESEPASNRWM